MHDRVEVRRLMRWFADPVRGITLTEKQARWVKEQAEAGNPIMINADENGKQYVMGIPEEIVCVHFENKQKTTPKDKG